ncbi:MAG: hypothetical protein MR522_06495 [Trueperella sp.]|uniref:hypothetical protein n=1 Tax=Trueperella sp. TaxID=2699835 RepID=UPI0025ECBCD6|nr:hypothetical protein [Trueperella sp.]MCI7305893.1 hypothetical protein [Trueperella sp.]
MSEGFWARKYRDLVELSGDDEGERYADMLPLVERLLDLETTGKVGSDLWRLNLEKVARKIVDEWPWTDEQGFEMLTHIDAAQKRRR